MNIYQTQKGFRLQTKYFHDAMSTPLSSAPSQQPLDQERVQSGLSEE